MFAEESQYLPPQVGGNGDADVTGEKPKGLRGSKKFKFVWEAVLQCK